MAGRVDILLKVIGDARDAVRGFDDTTRAAQKTEAQTAKTQGAVSQFFQSVPGMATAATVALGFVERQFSQIQDAIASGKMAAAQRDLTLATTPAQEAEAIQAGAQGAAYKRRLNLTNPYTWTPGNILADGGSLLGTALGLGGRARRERRDDLLEQQLTGMSSEDLVRLAPYLPEAGRLAPRVAAAERYRQGTTNVTNVYPTGTNPRNVDQNMARYQRINGTPRRP